MEFQLIVLYSVKILIKCEGRIKIFSHTLGLTNIFFLVFFLRKKNDGKYVLPLSRSELRKKM